MKKYPPPIPSNGTIPEGYLLNTESGVLFHSDTGFSYDPKTKLYDGGGGVKFRHDPRFTFPACYRPLTSSSTSASSTSASTSKTTVPSMIICHLCQRKFASLEKLKRHEDLSAMHKENLEKKERADRERIEQERRLLESMEKKPHDAVVLDDKDNGKNNEKDLAVISTEIDEAEFLKQKQQKEQEELRKKQQREEEALKRKQEDDRKEHLRKKKVELELKQKKELEEKQERERQQLQNQKQKQHKVKKKEQQPEDYDASQKKSCGSTTAHAPQTKKTSIEKASPKICGMVPDLPTSSTVTEAMATKPPATASVMRHITPDMTLSSPPTTKKPPSSSSKEINVDEDKDDGVVPLTELQIKRLKEYRTPEPPVPSRVGIHVVPATMTYKCFKCDVATFDDLLDATIHEQGCNGTFSVHDEWLDKYSVKTSAKCEPAPSEISIAATSPASASKQIGRNNSDKDMVITDEEDDSNEFVAKKHAKERSGTSKSSGSASKVRAKPALSTLTTTTTKEVQVKVETPDETFASTSIDTSATDTNPGCVGLSDDNDCYNLNEFHCLARRHLEYFRTDFSHNFGLFQDQVGIRCKRCLSERTHTSSFYPSCLEEIYETTKHFWLAHLNEGCKGVSPERRSAIVNNLLHVPYNIDEARQYYIQSAKRKKLVDDTRDEGIRFDPSNTAAIASASISKSTSFNHKFATDDMDTDTDMEIDTDVDNNSEVEDTKKTVHDKDTITKVKEKVQFTTKENSTESTIPTKASKKKAVAEPKKEPKVIFKDDSFDEKEEEDDDDNDSDEDYSVTMSDESIDDDDEFSQKEKRNSVLASFEGDTDDDDDEPVVKHKSTVMKQKKSATPTTTLATAATSSTAPAESLGKESLKSATDHQPNPPLVTPADKDKSTHYDYLLLRQIKISLCEEADRLPGSRRNIPLGYPGLMCKYCQARKWFLKVESNFYGHAIRNIHNHLVDCPEVPLSIQKALIQMRKDTSKGTIAPQRVQFYQTIWTRIQNESRADHYFDQNHNLVPVRSRQNTSLSSASVVETEKKKPQSDHKNDDDLFGSDYDSSDDEVVATHKTQQPHRLQPIHKRERANSFSSTSSAHKHATTTTTAKLSKSSSSTLKNSPPVAVHKIATKKDVLKKKKSLDNRPNKISKKSSSVSTSTPTTITTVGGMNPKELRQSGYVWLSSSNDSCSTKAGKDGWVCSRCKKLPLAFRFKFSTSVETAKVRYHVDKCCGSDKPCMDFFHKTLRALVDSLAKLSKKKTTVTVESFVKSASWVALVRALTNNNPDLTEFFTVKVFSKKLPKFPLTGYRNSSKSSPKTVGAALADLCEVYGNKQWMDEPCFRDCVRLISPDFVLPERPDELVVQRPSSSSSSLKRASSSHDRHFYPRTTMPHRDAINNKDHDGWL